MWASAGFYIAKYNKYNKGKWWAHLDSNQEPSGYEPVALTT